MKTVLKAIGLMCIATLFVACSQNQAPTPYKITGDFISMHPEVSEEVAEVEESFTDVTESTENEADSATEEEVDVPIDLSSATLSVFYETTDSDGNVETVSLVEESFNGSFEFESETAQPTEVIISLQLSEDEEPMEINTVVGTGHDLHFTLFDHQSPRADQLVLVGTSNQVLDPENKFTISGDLSTFGDEFKDYSTVYLSANIVDENGDTQSLQWGPVLLQDDSFLIEGDIAEPTLASLSISSMNNAGRTDVILEPLGEISISKLGNQTTEIGTTASDESYHGQLISSWQQNEEYIELVNSWTAALELSRNPPEPTESEDETATDDETSSSKEETTESIASVEPAEGCEDAEVGKYVEPVLSLDEPEWYILRLQAIDVRNATLQAVVEGSDDRIAQHLAMKLSPYSDDADELVAWKTLSEKFDAKFVDTHISPRIESIEKRVLLAANDAALVPGQKVPEFALLNLEGEEVSLYDVLSDNDMVLIDFWASWCGPCIADFPHLKKLYAAYSEEKFEIVGVSIDDTHEDWEGGVEDNTLPWVQLGELEGWYGHIGVQYGVGWVPKGYLVDTQGCIYEKDIRPAALQEFLVNRHGMHDSLITPDEETDDSSDVSG